MIDKTTKSGNWKLYVSVAIFSIGWPLLFMLTPMTREIEYGWNHFIVNLPERLYRLKDSENSSYTFLFGKYINKPSRNDITITAVDEHTLKKYGWPVKRRIYGEAILKLKKLGVKAVGMDVLLFEADKTDPASDKFFVDAVEKAGNVVGLVGVDQNTWGIQKPEEGPLKGLVKACALVAYPNVDITKDADGQVRRYNSFYPTRASMKSGSEGAEEFLSYSVAGLKDVKCWADCKHTPLPSLGMAPYIVASGTPIVTAEQANMSEAAFDRYEQELNYRYIVSRRANPAWSKDENKKVISSFRHISIRDIIEDKLAPEERAALKGGITYLGSTATGAFDHVPSPFLNQLPGVEVHATFLDNFLSRDFRIHFNTDITILLMIALPWVPLLLRKYSLKVLVSVCLGVIAALLVADIALLANRTMLPFLPMVISIFLPFAYITVDKGLAEGREKKWIKNTFGQYLSPKIVEIITRDPSKLSLGGEKRDMTAFFLDIAGFTTMSEKLTPEQLTTMLNEYLSGLTDIILKNDGVVDKYIGDCIMAFWNAPLDQKDHRRLACLAAVECQGEMTRLNQSLTQFTIKPSCRIGLNSGPMVVGNMGSRTRLSYTVMGDSVNLASRLEGANKYFHSKIMASEYTYDEAKDAVEARTLGQIRVVGKAIPVRVYELLAKKGAMDAKTAKVLAAYNDGLDHFYKGAYEKANKAFKAALEAEPKDGPSAFYLDLAEKYAVSVPKDWDGTFNLTSK